MQLFSWIKNNPVNRIVHFVKNSSVWLIFSAFLGLAIGQAKKSRKNQSYSAWPNLIARKNAVKARKEAIKNWNSIAISSFPPQSVWLNALHGLVHLFISSIQFYYLDIEGFSIYLGFSIYFMYYCKIYQLLNAIGSWSNLHQWVGVQRRQNRRKVIDPDNILFIHSVNGGWKKTKWI